MAIFQFGPIIKSKREELGYTQEELADDLLCPYAVEN